jgi:copper chaperone
MTTATTQSARTLTISGMTCGHCVSRVTRTLSATPGVQVVEVSVGSATVLAANDQAIQAATAALADLGYTASVAPTASKASGGCCGGRACCG